MKYNRTCRYAFQCKIVRFSRFYINATREERFVFVTWQEVCVGSSTLLGSVFIYDAATHKYEVWKYNSHPFIPGGITLFSMKTNAVSFTFEFDWPPAVYFWLWALNLWKLVLAKLLAKLDHNLAPSVTTMLSFVLSADGERSLISPLSFLPLL